VVDGAGLAAADPELPLVPPELDVGLLEALAGGA
jgi:hypothetical protein